MINKYVEVLSPGWSPPIFQLAFDILYYISFFYKVTLLDITILICIFASVTISIIVSYFHVFTGTPIHNLFSLSVFNVGRIGSNFLLATLTLWVCKLYVCTNILNIDKSFYTIILLGQNKPILTSPCLWILWLFLAESSFFWWALSLQSCWQIN